MQPGTQIVQRRLGRPTREQAAALLDLVVAGAEAVFLREGYGASMDDIAAECGVSKLTIYRRFSGKEALFIAVVDRALQALEAALMTSRDPDQPAMKILENIARKMFDESLREDNLRISRLLMTEALSVPAIRGRLAEWERSSNRALVSAIEAAQVDGEIVEGDPVMLAASLRDLLDSLARRLRYLHLPSPSEEEAAAFFAQRWQLFERAVRVQPI